MIIKSMSRKSTDFLQLLSYINKGEQVKNQAIFHHLRSDQDDIKKIAQEFTDNTRGVKYRTNGVQCYHEILSLPHYPRNQEKFPEILADLAQQYLNLRVPDGLAYAKAHLDTEHPHIHFCISANNIRQRNKHRLSKTDFNQVKQQIRAYIREKFPELLPYQKEKPLHKRQEKSHPKNHGQTIKLELSQTISTIFLSENSLEPVLTGLNNSGIVIYARGSQRLYGAKFRGKKYRLKTLGLHDFVNDRVKQWETTKNRLNELEKIQRQKEQLREKEQEREEQRHVITYF